MLRSAPTHRQWPFSGRRETRIQYRNILQRSGQPVSRMKAVGNPAGRDSPCSEWNISVTRSCASLGTGSGSRSFDIDTARTLILAINAPRFSSDPVADSRALRRSSPGDRGSRRIMPRAKLFPILELVIAVADLQQGVGALLRIGVSLQQRPETRSMPSCIALAHVTRFGQPVLGIIGQARSPETSTMNCSRAIRGLDRTDPVSADRKRPGNCLRSRAPRHGELPRAQRSGRHGGRGHNRDSRRGLSR